MDADGAVLIALFVNRERGLFAVLMKVLDPQPASGSEPDAGLEVSFEDGAVAEIEHVIAGGKSHQLTRAGGGERTRALERIGRLSSDELGVGGESLLKTGARVPVLS
jgi:hypothetical protein